MGLDMYVFASQPGKNCQEARESENALTGEEWEALDPGKRPVIELGYWRKANAIFGWFERNVGPIDNCVPLMLGQQDIIDLREACGSVLADHDETGGFAVGQEELPPTEGFFFGGYEYDDGYLEDVKHTIEVCDAVLSAVDWTAQDVWFYAWW